MRRTSAAASRLLSIAAALALFAAGCGTSSSPATGSGSSSGKSAPVALRMQLSWQYVSQFAGYMVAKAKGFYSQAGLNVTIIPGGPNVNDIQQLVSGQADITVDRTSTLFSSTDKGIPIKAIAEFDHQSGFWLVAKKSTGITTPARLKGKRIGVFADDVFEYDAMLMKMGLNPKTDVSTFFEGFTMTPFISNQYPVAQVTSWGELQSLYQAGIQPAQLTFFKPSDYGVGILHGCLIATDAMIQSRPQALKAFVQATIRGWEWAYAHPSEAVAIVVKAAGPTDSKPYETAVLNAMKQIQWINGKEPANWGAIPVSSYQAQAKVVENAHVVTRPINVQSDIDTAIVSQP